MGPAHEAAVDFLENRGVHVWSAQPWVCGVGLFLLQDVGVHFPLLQLPPQPLGNDTFVHFHKNDKGVGFRGAHGFCDGCLMFLWIPLDLRNTENIHAAVNIFGKFHHWVEEEPYMVRSIVFASFLEDILVPRDVVFTDFAAYGGAKVSWTTPFYILGANFADQMPGNEDPMPLDGNHHPLPGGLVPDVHNFVLPPYPAIGWNDLPPVPPPMHDNVDPDNWGHGHLGDDDEEQ